MNTLFDCKTKQWSSRTADRLPRHDLFFGTPDNRPTAGLPIGDGDTGSLLWLEKDALRIHINKCDLWQDAPRGVTWNDAVYCSGHEEELTCVKHGGEISLRFHTPVFEYLYQTKFCARLRLADASALLDCETPFGALRARAFSGNGVSVLSFHGQFTEKEAPELRLSRFGSRTLWHWYWKQKFVPETGLDGTAAFAENDSLYITQKLDPTKFCIGLRIVYPSGVSSRAVNTHCAQMKLPEAERQDFTLFWTIKTGQTAEEAKNECERALNEAVRKGENALYEEHAAAWKSFWEKSYLAIPDDYLENVYYLYLYYMNSESRGAYPPLFTSGLWGFYHDFVPWNYFFHYKEQHLYAPLDTAGHGELAECWYALRRNGIGVNRRFAKEVKGKNGIFLHDVTDRYGRGAEYHRENNTVAALCALQMLRHYRFTGDEAFLKSTALPFLRGATEYYLDFLRRGKDGLYHIRGASAYEGNETADDTITDLTAIRALFPAYLPYAEQETAEKMRDVLEHLAEPVTPVLEEGTDVEGGTFAFGVGRGRKPLGDGRIFAVGIKDGVPVRKSFGDPSRESQIDAFPDAELCGLYPAGLVGLKDRDTPRWNLNYNQLMLHPSGEQTGHWNMLPIFLARMGEGGLIYETLRAMLSNYQGFPNGFNAEGGEVGTLMGDAPAFYPVENYETEKKYLLRSDDFVHFDFETEPIVAEALLEGLLQSHEGVIRILPAAPKLPVAFRLFAEGGFAVGAEFSAEGFVVTVESLRGEDCYISLPSHCSGTALYAYVSHAGGEFAGVEIKRTVLGRETVLDCSALSAGDVLLLTSVPAQRHVCIPQEPSVPNGGMKRCGKAVLGSPGLIGAE